MTGDDPAFSIWLVVGVAAFLASLGFTLVALLISGRRIRAARQDSAMRVQRLDERVIALERQQNSIEAARREAPEIAQRVQDLEDRLARLEQRQPAGRSLQAAAGFETTVSQAGHHPSPALSFVDGLTRNAAAALGSAEGFRQFAQAAGGSGLALRTGSEGADEVSAPDAASVADLWRIPHDGRWLVYPGFNLLRSQSALLADSGRVARDRLEWLFEVEAGERLAAQRPAVMSGDGTVAERGVLQVPF